jgi:hypothetical protein
MMGKEKILAEAWHNLRATIDELDGSDVGTEAAIHIQWAIDLIDQELASLSTSLVIAQ